MASRADVLESRLGIEKVGGRRTDGEMVMSLGPVCLTFAAEAVQAEASELQPVFRALVADFLQTFASADFGPSAALPLREAVGHTELLEFLIAGSFGGRTKEELEAQFPSNEQLPANLEALMALGEVSSCRLGASCSVPSLFPDSRSKIWASRERGSCIGAAGDLGSCIPS